MSTSLIPAALDALVTTFTAALAPLQVFDGPPSGKSPTSGLYVGATDDDNTIEFQQRWAGQAHIARDEAFEIPNLLYVSSGDKGFSAHRMTAFAQLAEIEDALRANPTLGISTNAVRAQFGTAGQVVQIAGTSTVVRVLFTINVEGRI